MMILSSVAYSSSGDFMLRKILLIVYRNFKRNCGQDDLEIWVTPFSSFYLGVRAAWPYVKLL